MIHLLLTLFFLCNIALIRAQSVKQEIAWEQCIDGQGLLKKYKHTTNFDANGHKTAQYFKGEGVLEEENMTKDYAYDELGRIIRVRNYNEHGETFGETTYVYKKNYYIEESFSMYGSNQMSTYYYVDQALNVVEQKSYEQRSSKGEKQAPVLVKWVLFTYDKEGKLIGERHKSAQAEELYKKIYHYKKGTKQLLRITNSYWGANEKAVTILVERQGTTFIYDEEGRLIEKRIKDKLKEALYSYQYKNNQLWIAEEYCAAPFKKVKKIYKEGVLVREKYYAEEGWPYNNKSLLQEPYLEAVIDYEYK